MRSERGSPGSSGRTSGFRRRIFVAGGGGRRNVELPEALQSAVLEAISREGFAGPLEESAVVRGGYDSRACRLRVGDSNWFLKWAHTGPPDKFVAEARGLAEIAQIGGARVPRCVRAAEPSGDCPGFLLLEWVETLPAERYASLGHEFGEMLARFHQQAATVSDGRFGLEGTSYVGKEALLNGWHESWIRFVMDCRLGPEMDRCARASRSAEQRHRLERFRALAEETLGAHRCWPVLLHGDLWQGNLRFDRSRRLFLFDPGVYWGDREMDLAMLCLFDPFPDGFMAAYEAVWPLPPGWERRRDIYTMYHLLRGQRGGLKHSGRADALLRRCLD